MLQNLAKRKLASIYICFVILFISSCGGSKKNEKRVVVTQVQDTLEKTIETYLEANIPEDGPGVSVFVVNNSQLAYSTSRGMANILTSLKVNEDTGFSIASVSKFFTALAVMQLYESGLVSPQDSILNYLPEFPQAWQDITIHHLLTHQSGIPDWVNDMSVIRDWPDGVTNTDIVNFFSQNETLEFQPGSMGD
jgi:D-alanyl-D-alanine carboxypeptidase